MLGTNPNPTNVGMNAHNHIALVEKTFHILEALSASAGPHRLKEIAAHAGMGRSTAFRILQTMKTLGYVLQTGAGRYALSPNAFIIRPQAQANLQKIARRWIDRIRNELGESVWLGEWRRGVVVVTDIAEARQKLSLTLDVGDQCSLHADSLGKAVAAHLPRPLLDAALGEGRLPRYTDHTLTNRPALYEELARVRDNGFAINEEETIPGAIIIGAPIFDARDAVFAALSVACPIARCSLPKRRAMIAAVLRAGAAISNEMKRLNFESRLRPCMQAVRLIGSAG
jgi:DNA-binding IclR family transcriptional regulator